MNKIERYHSLIKERTRCYHAMMPFKCIPRVSNIQLLKTVVFYTNNFVWKKGMPKVIPPLTIIEGVVFDYNIYFQVNYGEHVQTFEKSTNTLTPRTAHAMPLDRTVICRVAHDATACNHVEYCRGVEETLRLIRFKWN